MHTNKARLAVNNHTGIRRNGGFAIGKFIECINGNIGRDAGSQVYLYLYIGCGIIRYFFDLDLAGIVCFYNGVD
jgi:hypothetical protein